LCKVTGNKGGGQATAYKVKNMVGIEFFLERKYFGFVRILIFIHRATLCLVRDKFLATLYRSRNASRENIAHISRL
jgi:hypothetical protein